jgi:hypothetical protein
LLCVHYFCGLHLDRKSTGDSPISIAKSILGQLLMCCSKRVDLFPVIKLGQFDSEDRRDVCKRFEAVLAQLPPEAAVFCVIDGLSFYIDHDDEEIREESRKLLKWVISLTRRQSEGCIFKLLITVPVTLHGGVEHWLEEDEILNVPRRVPSTGGFTEMKWEIGLGGELRNSAD